MKLKLSRSEKKAVARILVDIALADSVITNEEAAFMGVVSDALDIPIRDVKNSRDLSVTRCISILRDMDPDVKKEVGVLMLGMMAIDGDVDKEEVKLIAAACVAADIPIPDMSKK